MRKNAENLFHSVEDLMNVRGPITETKDLNLFCKKGSSKVYKTFEGASGQPITVLGNKFVPDYQKMASGKRSASWILLYLSGNIFIPD